MPNRQKQLLIGLAAVVLLWQGAIWADHLLLAPLRTLRGNVAAKQEKVDEKLLQVVAIEQAKTKLNNWRARSLSPDPGRKARPDAVEAQRQYTEWLTDLVHSVALDEVSVAPQRRSVSRNGVFVDVTVQIDGEGRYSQFLELMERFYRADVLQRVSRLQLSSLDVVGDPPVKFTLEVGALALTDAPQRRAMFPRTTLAQEVDAEGVQITVATSTDFPQKAPFRIRIDRELLEVTAMSGNDWTVVRGVERSEVTPHPERSTASLFRVNKTVPDLSRDEFRTLLSDNIFVKPTPPIQYDFQFGPFEPPTVVRGKLWDFSVSAREFDTARGEPNYRFTGELPPGLTINPQTGKMNWKLDAKTAAGEYPVTVEVRHPSAPGGQLAQKLTLVVAEPNTPPKFATVARQTAYRGQPFRLKVAATDPDQPAQKLTYKFGAGGPTNAKIDSRTGELEWTPSDDQALGPLTLAVVATDSGTPAQSTTLKLAVQVQEDTARLTELIGIVTVDSQREAWLFDKSQNQKTILHIGDKLRAADITATLLELDADTMLVEFEGESRTLKLGQSIRSLTKSPAVTRSDSDETQP